jgi:hypothetical protein
LNISNTNARNHVQKRLKHEIRFHKINTKASSRTIMGAAAVAAFVLESKARVLQGRE